MNKTYDKLLKLKEKIELKYEDILWGIKNKISSVLVDRANYLLEDDNTFNKKLSRDGYWWYKLLESGARERKTQHEKYVAMFGKDFEYVYTRPQIGEYVDANRKVNEVLFKSMENPVKLQQFLEEGDKK